MSNKDTVQFTFGVKELVRQLLTDPTTASEVAEALAMGPLDTKKPAGYGNLGTQEAQEWFSLFLATDRSKKAGEAGFIYRNTDGTRVSARLRRQPPKTQAAQAIPADAPAADIAAAQAEATTIDPQLLEQILRDNPELLALIQADA